MVKWYPSKSKWFSFIGLSAWLRKAPICFLSARPSVRLSAVSASLPLDVFPWNLILSRFIKTYGENTNLFVKSSTEISDTLCDDLSRFCYLPAKNEAQAALFKDPIRTAQEIFHLGYKNQSVYAVSGTSRCLFSDVYKTRKYSVGRAYSCWMLNLLVHHVTGRL